LVFPSQSVLSAVFSVCTWTIRGSRAPRGEFDSHACDPDRLLQQQQRRSLHRMVRGSRILEALSHSEQALRGTHDSSDYDCRPPMARAGPDEFGTCVNEPCLQRPRKAAEGHRACGSMGSRQCKSIGCGTSVPVQRAPGSLTRQSLGRGEPNGDAVREITASNSHEARDAANDGVAADAMENTMSKDGNRLGACETGSVTAPACSKEIASEQAERPTKQLEERLERLLERLQPAG
jgi:hypothetical protein